MDRRDVASLWLKIANDPPPPLLLATGLLHDRVHGHDRLPQPGFVGPSYREGGLIIFSLNPGVGGDGLSRDDVTQYELLNKLRKASGNEVIKAFDALMDHLARFMPNWKIIENNGLNSVFKEHKITFADVAYLNLCKWRTKSSSLSVGVKNESWLITKGQFILLNPGRIIVLGKGLWQWCDHQNIVSSDDAYIPRRRGDAGLAAEAVEIVHALKRTPLLPKLSTSFAMTPRW